MSLNDSVRQDVHDLYRLGLSFEQIAQAMRDKHGTLQYNEADVRIDLWHIECNEGQAKRQPYDPCSDDSLDPYEKIAHGLVYSGMADLKRGRPCSLGALAPWGENNERCRQTRYGNGMEMHTCAPDALAWLTSDAFLRWCYVMNLTWRPLMEEVLNQAETTSSLFPWLPLVPALVWRVACILQGEAGGMGHTGMWYVGDTMLSRKSRGDDWNTVLAAYYAQAKVPSEEAMAIAHTMLNRPWKPSGRIFCYSNGDRLTQGWKKGELVYEVNGQTLHLSTSWPGS